MRNGLKKLAATGAVGLSMLTTSLVGATGAHADSQDGCPYPYVCIYAGPDSSTIVAEFRDITSYYQSTYHGPGFSVVNTRNQDTVWLRIDHGGGPLDYECLTNASQPYNSLGSSGTLTGIMISSNTSC
ncbi:hypothetical protein [Streptomyces rubellomurinus]|uniref:Peptidase inhibitor family I36 n=1 Tax=Streptomyces rubellomurinus (strain ATCC 31215) TaxID=359131 RepID=A0A0F2TJ64_STRR3|nr:hypothetical protein [Streptomyces rubellomurinus]KJS63293.1 hypothetical protein VM95_03480 [Streptomyces rubellomurinus]